MAKNVLQNLTTLINNFFDVISQGSIERVKLVRELNRAFLEAYLSGEFDRMCKASISMGDSSFRHSMSTIVLRSGFKIRVQNDENLSGNDISELAKYVLASNPFVRQMMALGFDTLIIIGKHNTYGVRLQLSKFANPNQYFLGS
jgi:hypothetical protein